MPIDPCLLRSAVASCPPGIFGRITGGPESPPPAEAPAAGGLDIDLVRRLLRRTAILEFLGRTESASDTGSSSATLESSTLVLTKALITPAEVREGAGVRDCTSPTASTVSFLVGTTESQYVMVHYWQAARGSGEPAPLAVRNASAVTSTLIDRPPGPPHYESCLTLDALRVGITYEARVQTVTRGGSAEWSPIGSFCLAPCLPSFRIPAGTLSGERLELHAWGAYVSLPSTPASGSLEFFVRAAGCCDTWHFSTILSNYEPGQKLASHPIYPGLEFEYRLVLHGNDGRDYESGIGLFTTLRRKLFLQVSQFDVITDGDSGSVGEFTDMFVSLTTYGGECPAGASVCSARRTFNEIAVPLGGLDGDSPLNEGSIDVTQGTTIGVAPRIDFVLDGHGHHTYLLVTLVHEDDSPSITQPYDNGLYSIEFHVPQGIGAPGSSALKSGEVCALPNSSFSVLDRAAYLNGWYEGSSRGPWVQPSDAFVCVVEFP